MLEAVISPSRYHTSFYQRLSRSSSLTPSLPDRLVHMQHSRARVRGTRDSRRSTEQSLRRRLLRSRPLDPSTVLVRQDPTTFAPLVDLQVILVRRRHRSRRHRLRRRTRDRERYLRIATSRSSSAAPQYRSITRRLTSVRPVDRRAHHEAPRDMRDRIAVLAPHRPANALHHRWPFARRPVRSQCDRISLCCSMSRSSPCLSVCLEHESR